jgi:hypothetical protein
VKGTAKIARIGDQEVRPEREFVIMDGRNEWLGSEFSRQPFGSWVQISAGVLFSEQRLQAEPCQLRRLGPLPLSSSQAPRKDSRRFRLTSMVECIRLRLIRAPRDAILAKLFQAATMNGEAPDRPIAGYALADGHVYVGDASPPLASRLP